MKTVVITGVNKGLGLAIAIRLLQEDYRIIGVARTLTPEVETFYKNYNSTNTFHFLTEDLSITSSIHDISQKILKIERKPFALINNAAVGLDGVLGTQHEKEISLMLNLNLHSPILLTKYISRAMMISGEGRIINISSVVASTGFSGLSVYAATKAGLIGFTKSLSREVGKAGITVNAICPGYMETDMTSSLRGDKLESIRRRSPFNRFVKPDDVAATVSFLLSDDAKMITGTTLTVDAGSTA